jgi:phospholipase/lecithinase/hemolysin
MKRLRCLLLLCMCSIFAVTASAQTARFNAMYVFGDSLSDTGNDLILTKLIGLNPAVPPSESPHRTYYEGRFSNGPISFEYLWRLIKQNDQARVSPSLVYAQPGRNRAISYAFGGATSAYFATTPDGVPVTGLLSQVEAFRFGLLGRKPGQRALLAIWIGSNDYVTTTPNPPDEVVRNIKRAIKRLYQIGGRHFVVLNLPDLGLIPAAQAQGLGPVLSAVSRIHNALLAQAIAELSTTLPGIHITSIDVFTLGQSLLGSTITAIPALETLVPNSSSCLLLNPATCPDVPLALTHPFFYWDLEHPTTYIHGILGRAMYDALR